MSTGIIKTVCLVQNLIQVKNSGILTVEARF